MKQKKKDCAYPECEKCVLPECDKTENDLAALLKRRRYRKDPEAFRARNLMDKQKARARLPACNDCEHCAKVMQANKGGYTRLCMAEMRLIEQKVSRCPHWCRLRKERRKEAG